MRKDRGWNHRAHISTVVRDLPDETATDERQRRVTGQVDGTHTGSKVIGVRHLLFDLEVAARAEALDDEVDTGITRCIDGEAGKGPDLDHSLATKWLDRLVDHRKSFIERKQTARFRRIVHGCDDDVTEQLECLLDNTEVSEMNRVEAARIKDLGHAGPTIVPDRASGDVGTSQERHRGPPVALDPQGVPTGRSSHLTR